MSCSQCKFQGAVTWWWWWWWWWLILHFSRRQATPIQDVINHYVSLVSQLSVNCVHCSSLTACCYTKQDVILISIPVPVSSPKAISIPIPVIIPIPMHTSNSQVLINNDVWLTVITRNQIPIKLCTLFRTLSRHSVVRAKCSTRPKTRWRFIRQLLWKRPAVTGRTTSSTTARSAL